MVIKYIFSDSGANGNDELDICGAGYQNLLSVCFRYCDSVSFLVERKNITQQELLSSIEQHRIPVSSKVTDVYKHYNILPLKPFYSPNYQIRQYKLCDEVYQFLQKNVDSLFSWLHGWGYNNPTDPVFVRRGHLILWPYVST